MTEQPHEEVKGTLVIIFQTVLKLQALYKGGG